MSTSTRLPARGAVPSIVLVGVAALAAACTPAASAPSASASPRPSAAPPASAASVAPTAEIEGTFDAGGHELYLSCRGEGSPTVVYLHGASEEEGDAGSWNGRGIQERLADELRVCVYDRRNVGMSDEVPGTQTGADAVADLHALLSSAGVEPPYLLLGASFGGLLAHLYAGTHPDDVAAMLLLDAPVPAELSLEPLLPEEMRLDDAADVGLNERLGHASTYRQASEVTLPDIPVTYLLAVPSEWPTMGVPEWDAAILDVIRDHVAGMPRGRLVEVDSPHFMEAAVPDEIADEIRLLVEEVAGG